MKSTQISFVNPVSERDKRYTNSELIAPDCRGMNFYEIDGAFQDILGLYMPKALRDHLQPHLMRLGELAGGRLDELAETADKNPPVIQSRDRFGRDEDGIDYHPSYREMEKLAYGEFGMHAMTHRAGVLDWPQTLPTLAKYAFQYLFVQAEFGLMCPVSLTDTSAHLIIKFGSEELKQRFIPRMLSQDMDELLKGTQFMTEKSGGSDVANFNTVAIPEEDHWRLTGEKWFCSHIDADVAMVLARPEGAKEGSRGLALFAMPLRLENGRRNHYRFVRLKDKLGTRSMATGEIVLEGAVAFLVGDPEKGLKQILDQVNLSRLSHGVRAAAMMRRCLNESLQVARKRVAFDMPLIYLPLMRRQLLKLMLPTEQALSVFMYTASIMDAAKQGDAGAAKLLRILTPLLKFRSTRDNIQVATGAMEVRGGNGYVEDWVNARLVRDAHTGVLWEGTSNINALDVVTRAVRKEKSHHALAAELHRLLHQSQEVPVIFRKRIAEKIDRAIAFADEVAAETSLEKLSRQVAGALYHVTSSVLMTWEASRIGAKGGDARRLLLARLAVDHRLSVRDPMAVSAETWEEPAIELLLQEDPVPLGKAAELVTTDGVTA